MQYFQCLFLLVKVNFYETQWAIQGKYPLSGSKHRFDNHSDSENEKTKTKTENKNDTYILRFGD